MPRVEFEPTVAVFEWGKTVHALDRAATVTGRLQLQLLNCDNLYIYMCVCCHYIYIYILTKLSSHFRSRRIPKKRIGRRDTYTQYYFMQKNIREHFYIGLFHFNFNDFKRYYFVLEVDTLLYVTELRITEGPVFQYVNTGRYRNTSRRIHVDAGT
jgi:hypothetical protein